MYNKKGKACLTMLFFLLLGTVIAGIVFSDKAIGGTYTSTAHGSSTLRSSPASGVDRSVVTSSAYPDALGSYPKGHCGHCHDQHASVGGTEPTLPAAEGAVSYALFRSNFGTGNKNELCYACHETFNFTGTPDPPLGYGRYYVYSGKTNYNNSSHYLSANMIWPGAGTAGSLVPYSDSGNCINCHNPHGYDDGSGLVPSMLIKRDHNICFECHDGSPASKDIKTLVSGGSYYGHNVAGYSGQHLAGTLDTFANISANKHVECVDCHNPHMAEGPSVPATGGTLHTASANYQTSNGNLVSSLLTGVLGAVTSFSGTNWTVPTSYTLGVATKEYEICFKCHSGANTNVTTWGGAGVLSWTDVGREFSTSNQSYHPVAGALPVSDPGANGSSRLNSAQLAGSWAPGDTMYCSDCHNTNAATSKGPHGSTIKWMLSGTNKAWPYTAASGNGASSGTYRTLSNGTTSSGTDNGLFCLNCHPSPTSTNNVHQRGDHSSTACVGCHIRVPHGGKVSRLIAADNNASYTNLPARYTSNGNGLNHGGTTSTVLRKFTKTSYTSYSKNNCYSGYSGCSDHNSSGNGTESW